MSASRGASLGALVFLCRLAHAAPAAADELSAVRGDVTVLAFWASWCPPCADELPKLATLAQRFAGDPGLRVAGVSVDDDETRAGADAEWAEAGPALPLVHDGAALLTRLLPAVREPTLPLVIVLDRRDRGYWRAGSHASAASLAREVASAVSRLRAGHGAAPRGWQPLASSGATGRR